MPDAFTRGDQVYSTHGDIAEYITRTSDGYIVRPLYWGSTEEPREPHFGSPEVWRDVYITPPVAIVDEKVAAKLQELQGVEARLQELRAEALALDRARAARLAAIKQHEALALIEDFIAGRITHYVEETRWGSPFLRIIPFAEARCGCCDNNRCKDLKLLTLFGKTNGDLQWRLSYYSDGSGSNQTVVTPCTSLEMAQKVARDRIEAEWTAWRESDTQKDRSTTRVSDAAETARALGFDVPADVETWLHERKVFAARAKVDQLTNDLVAAQAALAAAQDAA